ncbi:MAG: transporter substrate-binding domain-containing protein [Betaproteobacteria bacterium]|nr:transporter substrate-binding domain-containing protein [Betaproteobacteria bacterium]
MADNPTADLAQLVPTGKLRMGINGANATLYARAADGSASGIAADIGKFIADQLGVPFEPTVYPGAAAYTASFGTGAWDIIVTGRNPFAATLVDFLPDVIEIDYVYLAAPGSDFAGPDQVDKPGVRIGVPKNASADAYLTPRLKAAVLVRLAGDADTAVACLTDNKIDLYATGIESVEALARRVPGSKLLGAFNTVAFAVSTGKGWTPAAAARMSALVNAAKAAGIVQKAITRSGQKGVRAAP